MATFLTTRALPPPVEIVVVDADVVSLVSRHGGEKFRSNRKASPSVSRLALEFAFARG
jgi:hypothetical protein